MGPRPKKPKDEIVREALQLHRNQNRRANCLNKHLKIQSTHLLKNNPEKIRLNIDRFQRYSVSGETSMSVVDRLIYFYDKRIC